ncbi:MAG: hypothetical protein AAF733_01925 [Verrucomicrobiota bacterium]
MPETTDISLLIRTSPDEVDLRGIFDISRALKNGELEPDDEAAFPNVEEWKALQSILFWLDQRAASRLRIAGAIDREIIAATFQKLSEQHLPENTQGLGEEFQAIAANLLIEMVEARDYLLQRVDGLEAPLFIEPHSQGDEGSEPSDHYTSFTYEVKPQPSPRRNRLPIATACVALLLLGSAGYFLSKTENTQPPEVIVADTEPIPPRTDEPAPTEDASAPVPIIEPEVETPAPEEIPAPLPEAVEIGEPVEELPPPMTAPEAEVPPSLEMAKIEETVELEPEMTEPAVAPEPAVEVDPYLEEIVARFRSRLEAEVDGPHRKLVDDLSEKYLSALQREETRAIESGSLDSVIAIRVETAQVNGEETDLSVNPDAELSARFLQLKETYQRELGILMADRNEIVKGLIVTTDTELEVYQRNLTQDGDIDKAVHIKNIRRVFVEKENFPMDLSSVSELD